MKKTKLPYVAPAHKVLDAEFEECLLTLSDEVNGDNHTQYLTDDGYEEL